MSNQFAKLYDFENGQLLVQLVSDDNAESAVHITTVVDGIHFSLAPSHDAESESDQEGAEQFFAAFNAKKAKLFRHHFASMLHGEPAKDEQMIENTFTIDALELLGVVIHQAVKMSQELRDFVDAGEEAGSDMRATSELLNEWHALYKQVGHME